LELEITETVLLDRSGDNLRILHELRDLGVKIAMHDFGTGYSSLSYLRGFPFDKTNPSSEMSISATRGKSPKPSPHLV
jgi:EAL domain-containing protein (putative c-di-GMP-specific phosphodiesterase class I)